MSAESIELLPCPFCGGEAKLELTTQYYTDEPEMENAFIRCMKCGVWTDEHVYATEAAAAWNTRHVGTCKDLGGTGANGEQVFNCSECGCVLSLYDRDGTNTLCTGFIYDYPRYCPACGAKVVDE